MASSTRTHADVKTFPATAVALAAYVRVAIDSSGNVAVAGLTNDWHGITLDARAASANTPVLLRNAEGTVQFLAAGAISRGAKLYAAANGKVDDAVNQYFTGFIALEAASADGDVIEAVRYGGAGASSGSGAIAHICIPINLASIAGSGDVLSNLVMPAAGAILSTQFNTTVAVTTGSKAATLNLEINTTNVTGGDVALTSATCTPLGAIIAGSAITAANVFAAADTISVESSAVTAFAEGAGVLTITVQYF